ncbi:MAG: fatty acyl-AMP ligase [Acidobacteriota bacterium]
MTGAHLSSDLVERLAQMEGDRPDSTAYIFLPDGEREGGRWTYAELRRQTRAVGEALRRHAAPGDRALLLYPSGLDFIAAFFGCLYAGVIAVPCPLPRPNRPSPRMAAILPDASPRWILSTAAARRSLEAAPSLATATGVDWLDTDAVQAPAAASWRPAEVGSESVAFLQYTSGSTAAPRGVMVTRENLSANLEMMRLTADPALVRVIASWLPHFHDMGLIGTILYPFWCGGTGIMMPPESFFLRPVRWLEMISRYRAVFSVAPDFAYDLCARQVRLDQCPGLDLRHWRITYSGAETVRPDTLRRFTEVFGASGFKPEAFLPCYGLAEATLMVSSAEGAGYRIAWFDPAGLERGQARPLPAGRGRALTSCGRPRPGSRLRIVDPESARGLPDGAVGEVWTAGPQVARGYWNNPEATAAVFGGWTADGDGPFLRTGDLGFLAGGELFLVGRCKDLIILQGQNYYPDDIEASVASAHPALRPRQGAAFSVDAGDGERLVVAHEIERAWRSAGTRPVLDAIRLAVAAEHGIRPHAVLLLRPHSLPTTSSGKVRRGECRRRFLAGELAVEAEYRATKDVAPQPPTRRAS